MYFNITTNLQEKFKKDVLSQAYTDFCNGRQNDRVYQLTQSKLKDIKSYPFIYWISDEFREKFHHETIAERYDICNGISSGGNNEQFYRYHWEVCRDDIMCSSNLNNYKWVFINKGGPYQKWYGNIWLVFLWENNGKKLKELKKKCSSIRYGYENYYFKEGLAFTGASSKSLSVRFQPQFCIFERAGKSIFAKEENDDYLSLLAFMNSSLCAYLMDSLNPTVSFQSGDIERIPYIEQKDKYVKIITQQNIDIVKDLSKYSIIEPLYQSTPIKCCNNIYNSILDFYIWEASMLTIVLLNEALINKSVFKSFTLKEVDIRLVYDEEGMPVGNYSISSQAKEAYKEWLSTNTEFPASPEVWEHIESLEINEDQPHIDDFESLYQNNNGWEEFCIKHKMNPIEVWHQFKNAGILPPQRTQVLAFELITDVIRSVLAKDDDGVIPLTERMGEEQLAGRIEQELVERGYNSAQISQIIQLLGTPLDKYLQDKFFKQQSDHLNLIMYLPKTPFIWHLTSGPHHAIELYISIYKWSRDTVFRIKSVYIANRETALNDRLLGIDVSTANGQLEAGELKEQLKELKAFAEKIDELLASGYDPKLDDGVGKNIAPLQKSGL